MSEQKNTPNYVDLKRPTIFAHRGSSAHAPENTLAAFKLAVDQHADAIELDATLSADGQVVVIHDDTVDRTTDGSGRVNLMTVSELKRLDAGSKFNSAYRSEKIPTLMEVFETVGQKIFINVEIKNNLSPTDDLPERVIALVKECDLQSSVMVSSFNIIALIRARSLLPTLPLGLITIRGLAQLTLRSKLVRIGPRCALHAHISDITPKLIQDIHQTNSRVHVFTINESDVMQRMYKAGIDGIFTPNPLLAQKVLTENQ
jgi:glycerophosphoryl diester phosphodiesterase